MNEEDNKWFSAWSLISEIAKIAVLFVLVFGLDLSWGMSILIAFVFAVALLIFGGIVQRSKRKSKDEV